MLGSTSPIRITIVSGSAFTGIYAPDGSYNCVDRTGQSGYFGIYHPCGAFNITEVSTESPTVGVYNANGSWNVRTDSANTNGAAFVSVVSGSLSGGALLLQDGLSYIFLQDNSLILLQ